MRLLDRTGIPSTFFVTGHTADTYPDSVRAIAQAGHEIGHHGYLHENPAALGSKEENGTFWNGDLPPSTESPGSVPSATARRPGTTALTPSSCCWSRASATSSLMGKDYEPYWCRVGDVIQPDGPYIFGPEVDLVELPVSWILDDFPHFEYIRLDNRLSPGLSAASKVEEIWRDEFDYMYREVDGGPDHHNAPAGDRARPPDVDAGATDRTLPEARGVRFATLADVAEEFRATHARGGS